MIFNYKQQTQINLDTLKGLQKAHLLHVPFENLDIHYNKPITLDINRFYQKIVIQNRGGFCYELNGLFERFLKQLGLETKIISARVFDYSKKIFGKDYDHLVKIDHAEYLVDVGFGEFIFHPLKLELNATQFDPRGSFILEAHEGNYYKVSKAGSPNHSIEYIFTLQARNLNEFTDMCQYHQTNEASHFTQKKLISKPTEHGRITLTGNTLKITEHETVTVNQTFDEHAYAHHLKLGFDIDLSSIDSSTSLS